MGLGSIDLSSLDSYHARKFSKERILAAENYKTNCCNFLSTDYMLERV